MNDPTPRPESTHSLERAESEGQTTLGAQGSLVERLAEAIWAAQPEQWRDNTVPEDYADQARAALPLVAAEVEAAVSVVRAERDEALGIDARGTTKAERLWGLVNTYRADLERTEDRLERMVLIARERGDALNFADDHLPAWHAIRDERDALREKVAKVEAIRDKWLADYPGPGASWRGDPDEWWRTLAAALSDPTTHDQKGGEQ